MNQLERATLLFPVAWQLDWFGGRNVDRYLDVKVSRSSSYSRIVLIMSSSRQLQLHYPYSDHPYLYYSFGDLLLESEL